MPCLFALSHKYAPPISPWAAYPPVLPCPASGPASGAASCPLPTALPPAYRLQRHMPRVGFYQPIGADPLAHHHNLPKHVAM